MRRLDLRTAYVQQARCTTSTAARQPSSTSVLFRQSTLLPAACHAWDPGTPDPTPSLSLQRCAGVRPERGGLSLAVMGCARSAPRPFKCDPPCLKAYKSKRAQHPAFVHLCCDSLLNRLQTQKVNKRLLLPGLRLAPASCTASCHVGRQSRSNYISGRVPVCGTATRPGRHGPTDTSAPRNTTPAKLRTAPRLAYDVLPEIRTWQEPQQEARGGWTWHIGARGPACWPCFAHAAAGRASSPAGPINGCPLPPSCIASEHPAEQTHTHHT